MYYPVGYTLRVSPQDGLKAHMKVPIPEAGGNARRRRGLGWRRGKITTVSAATAITAVHLLSAHKALTSCKETWFHI